MTERYDLPALVRILTALRHPESGCRWALQQDFSSIAPHTIEEAYEVADAIRRGDMPALKEELGDLLLQVVFHARIAEEHMAFDLDDVIQVIAEKLIRRNPHVFGSAEVRTAGEQSQAWEAMKESERAAEGALSLMDGIPSGMAELQRSIKLQRRAARAGFDWVSAAPVLEKLHEETAELQQAIAGGDRSEIASELGDMLLVLTNLARHLDVDPGDALRGANARFEQRFRAMEHAAGSYQRLKEMGLEEKEFLWQEVKRSIRETEGHE